MRFWTTLCLGAWAAVALAQSPSDAGCRSCHDQAQKMQNAAHAAVGCAGCHQKHENHPHPAGVKKPECATCHSDTQSDYARGVHGQAPLKGSGPDCATCHGSAHDVLYTGSRAFRKSVPDTCGMCHSEVAEQYKTSIHGRAVARGVSSAPLCTDCHGEHSIERHTTETSPVHVRHIRETCARCHGDIRLSSKFGLPPDRVASFDATFHGLAAKAGAQTVANCASCHGFHGILPSADPRSTIHPKNLPATCGRCHNGAGRRFALSPVHQLPGNSEPPATRWARRIYWVLIPLLVGLMLLHNAGDWFRKLLRGRPGAGEAFAAPELRMLGFERVEHLVLALSFIVLAWTGFALRYPDPWWARPLTGWGKYWGLRGTIHRVASIVFLAVAAAHAISLIASRSLRQHWRALLPRYEDVPLAWQNFGYNLGVRRAPAELPAHSYVEKFEYWAVVWGAVIMALTGVLLWAHNLALAWLPKAVVDFAGTVHFYEAVLASLAVVVWHFYAVIFDPDVYPMETAWLTGFSVKKRRAGKSHQPPA